MNLKTFLVEVTKQIGEGAASAKCAPNPRGEMDVALAPDGNVASRFSDNCVCVHMGVTLLPNI